MNITRLITCWHIMAGPFEMFWWTLPMDVLYRKHWGLHDGDGVRALVVPWFTLYFWHKWAADE